MSIPTTAGSAPSSDVLPAAGALAKGLAALRIFFGLMLKRWAF